MNAAPRAKPSITPYQRWVTFSAAVMRAFHVYAGWLVSISWKRFIVLAIALMIGVNILVDLPPFTWRMTSSITTDEEPEPAAEPEPPAKPVPISPSKTKAKTKPEGSVHYEVSIDERGVRVIPRKAKAASSAPSSAASGSADASEAHGDDVDPDLPSITIGLPKNADAGDIKNAIEEARRDVQQALEEANSASQQAAAEAREAAAAVARDAARMSARKPRQHTTVVHFGDFLIKMAVFWILGSALIKVTYKGRLQAEVKAAQATETAEAESLKRQVVEARMAAMQAQVEPHFLFNTLASIDHLIETDPPRASQMQKNLISLLRASMPTMREANASGVRDLGRELAVIKPYLEILKMRMEERLQTEIDVPEGLLSAEFPPMMIQSLVENAIKHGLEPKAEGGSLRVKAEVTHGKLAVTVADTGLGFGRAATSGTGVGLANIRERLMLLYGPKASVTVSENLPCGTKVCITVPYRSRSNDETGAQA
ncbi:sensor histidine kinase [Paucibacter sp. Y2R2-4]|uniref:sensor histidine kinase n=1 Tax=Paucibacter sp. Y2R2-4 TaxID=2893553 RepID=UPI0021E4276D|nr:histidine kinase [Paucibacter sp. Y2R2-4]MCV2350935.1 histidine kinase [Paucibacter sp. Y2R2-4]